MAAAAGVSKVTAYSRRPGKADLIGAALAHLRPGRVPVPVGRVRDDLVALLEAMREQYAAVGSMSILGTCLADGVARGELRDDVDPDRAVSLVVGCLHADHLTGREVAAPGWAADVVDTASAGLLTTAGSTPGGRPRPGRRTSPT